VSGIPARWSERRLLREEVTSMPAKKKAAKKKAAKKK
jgi:hypothetical protein